MPELNGNPRKDELRDEIRKLRAENDRLQLVGGMASRALEYAWCRIEELEEKIKRMEQKARELVDEAASDTETKTGERYSDLQRRFEPEEIHRRAVEYLRRLTLVAGPREAEIIKEMQSQMAAPAS